ncbi:MAG: hypothetical protein GX647_09010 [Clostridiales bacterium]|jgi:hypothetical protein|nr:hypothetical protein [Clostridiales bacterium]
MLNQANYYKQFLEREAESRAHARHVEEFYQMAKTMIEQMVPILIKKYLAENGMDATLNLETYLNGARLLNYEMELSSICARILRDALTKGSF